MFIWLICVQRNPGLLKFKGHFQRLPKHSLSLTLKRYQHLRPHFLSSLPGLTLSFSTGPELLLMKLYISACLCCMSHFLSCSCTVTVYPHALLSAQQRSLVSDSALLPVAQHHTFSVLFLFRDLVTSFSRIQQVFLSWWRWLAMEPTVRCTRSVLPWCFSVPLLGICYMHLSLANKHVFYVLTVGYLTLIKVIQVI